ncbi:MAG TPA: DnaJ domain-containing protein [Bryobacteraceae bacterium]|jgi:DnaJ domain|nr:DnaJ domain-containing protein [Bryobacteraceae bacterium]
MHAALTQARLRIRESLDAHPELTIILDATGSPSSRMRARFLAQEGETLKVHVTAALGLNLLVSIAGEIDTGAGREPLLGRYRVASCKIAGIGKYQADLTAEQVTQSAGSTAPKDNPDEEADHYQVLQVSRTADVDTIRRVFHVLAQRYHPDNRETGNQEKFRQVVEAHTVLSDPVKRAAHDVFLAREDKIRFKLFDTLQSTEGVQAEIRKRVGILRLLYGKRLTDPQQPTMRGRDFAELLACPLEHLEFALWMLREQRLIYRSDSNHFEITWQGVQAFEAEQSDFAKKALIALPAPAQSA